MFANTNQGFGGFLTGGAAISGAPCGSFYDTTIQSAALANTAYAMKLNSVDTNATNLCSVASGSRITVPESGIYNVQFSAQLQRISGTNAQVVDIWLRKNGNGGDVSNSNTHVELQGTANYLVTAWNFFIFLNAGDFIELMWATTTTAIQLYYDVANTIHPATPSVIATINRIS